MADQKKKSSFLKRTISGLVLVVVVVEMTVIAPWTFYTLWGLIGFLSLWEYYRLLGEAFSGRGKEIKKPVESVVKNRGLYLTLGTLYILVPVVLLRFLYPGGESFGGSLGGDEGWEINAMMVVTLLFIVWLNDTGAYLVGMSIGKHKMAPVISPKKSWEGFFGGLVFGVGTALVMYALYWKYVLGGDWFVDEAELMGWPMKLKWAGFGLVVALAAVGGDLIESKFKRTLGVKDSGKIIPGHGGMLDRFDALFLAVPAAWIYIRLTELI